MLNIKYIGKGNFALCNGDDVVFTNKSINTVVRRFESTKNRRIMPEDCDAATLWWLIPNDEYEYKYPYVGYNAIGETPLPVMPQRIIRKDAA